MDSYKLSRMIKAKGDSVLPVYDANGNLIGLVDPSDVMAVADTPGKAAPAAPQPAPAAAPAAPAAVEAPLAKAQMRLAGALAPMGPMQARTWSNAAARGALMITSGLGLPAKQAAVMSHDAAADVLRKSRGRATPDDFVTQIEALIKACR